MRTKILITGATGILGRALTLQALEKGLDVILPVRAVNDQSAAERLYNCLGDDAQKYKNQIGVIAADLLEPNFGLKASDFTQLHSTVNIIIHCAGDVSFNDQNRDRVFQTNVKGTHYLLEFASTCEHLEVFVHVSTAYVCGDYEGSAFEDQLDYGQEFSTPYEESKFHAELLVQLYKKQSHLPIIIVRPSIILEAMKDLERTRIPAINSLIILLADVMKSVNDSGTIQKLRVPAKFDAIVDLVPIKYVIESILALSFNRLAYGKTFHLTNPNSPQLQHTFNLLNEEIGSDLSLLECVEPGSISFAELSKFEKMLCLNIQPYLSHLSTKIYFDTNNASVMRQNGFMPECPPISKEILVNIIRESVEYANR